jgi:AraC-like DNA-binding protein
MLTELEIHMPCPVKAQNAGLFISRGDAMHPTRVIESHEMIFVIQGSLDMWEEDKVFHLTEGNVLHLFPHRKHGSTKIMPPDLKFYWIHFTIDDSIQTGEGDTINPVTNLPQTATLSRPEALERLFRIFINEQETGTLRPISANLLTMLMILEVSQQANRKSDISDLNAVATWANSYIRMNFDRPITASKVASAVGYNVDYLGRIYRQAYGVTLTEAIHRRRVQKASEYLLNSNLNISQIAAICGFSDLDYFRRIFKRYMKIAPSDYRDENSRLHVITH